MDLEIIGTDCKTIGIVDEYKSLIWTRKYFQAGGFELSAPVTINNIYCLKENRMIIHDAALEVGYINTILIEDTEDDGEMITVSGVFMEGRIANRAVLQENTTLAAIVTNNCITADSARIIPNLVIGNCENIVFDNTCKGKNLGEFIEALARRDNFGYRVIFNRETKQLEFETHRGLDRSIEQTINPQVTFSQEYDNLLTCTYNKSDVGAIDSVYVTLTGLEGIQNPETIPEYHISGKSGFERLETVVEVQATTYSFNNMNGDKLTFLEAGQTLKDMIATANAAIVPTTENFEADVSFASGYKIDYDLGDIVTVFNEKWGKKITQRICEVVEVYDNETNSVTPTFGSPALTIMDILKK